MANRRLISKNVFYRDEFSTLSPDAAKLYLYMILEADDDGFVGHPRQVLMISEVGPQALDELIDRRYVIRFKSGVCVVSHWLVHNIIDRAGYTPTEFKIERSQVYVNDENVYSLV